MKTSTHVKVVGADRLDDAVIITFSDGRVGYYTSALLYDMLASARELFNPEDADESEDLQSINVLNVSFNQPVHDCDQ